MPVSNDNSVEIQIVAKNDTEAAFKEAAKNVTDYGAQVTALPETFDAVTQHIVAALKEQTEALRVSAGQWAGIRNEQEAIEVAWAQAIEENKERAKKAHEEEVSGWEGFADKVAEFIEHPLEAAGQAVKGFMLEAGPLGTIAVAAGAALGEMGHKAYELVSEEASAVKQTQNLAYSLGLGFEQAEKLQEISRLAGVDIGMLSRASYQLAEALQHPATTGKKAHDVLVELGIHGRDTGALLLESFRKLAEIEDPTKRIAAAGELLGPRVARNMQGLLADSEKLIALVDELGGHVSENYVKNLEEAFEKIQLMHVAWDRFKRTLAGKIEPIIVPVIEQITAFIAGPSETMKSLKEQIQAVKDQLNTLKLAGQGTGISGDPTVGAALRNGLNQAALEGRKKQLEERLAGLERLAAAEKANADQNQAQWEKDSAAAKRYSDTAAKTPEAMKARLEELTNKVKDEQAALADVVNPLSTKRIGSAPTEREEAAAKLERDMAEKRRLEAQLSGADVKVQEEAVKQERQANLQVQSLRRISIEESAKERHISKEQEIRELGDVKQQELTIEISALEQERRLQRLKKVEERDATLDTQIDAKRREKFIEEARTEASVREQRFSENESSEEADRRRRANARRAQFESERYQLEAQYKGLPAVSAATGPVGAPAAVAAGIVRPAEAPNTESAKTEAELSKQISGLSQLIDALRSGNRERITAAEQSVIKSAPGREDQVRELLKRIEDIYRTHAENMAAIVDGERRKAASPQGLETRLFAGERQNNQSQLAALVGPAQAEAVIKAFDSGTKETIAAAKSTALASAPAGQQQQVAAILTQIEHSFQDHAVRLQTIRSTEERSDDTTRRSHTTVSTFETARAAEQQTFTAELKTLEQQLVKLAPSGPPVVPALSLANPEQVAQAKAQVTEAAPASHREEVSRLLAQIEVLYRNHAVRLAEILAEETTAVEHARNEENATFGVERGKREGQLAYRTGFAPASEVVSALDSGDVTRIAEAKFAAIAAAPESQRKEATVLLTKIEELYQTHATRLANIQSQEERVNARRESVSVERARTVEEASFSTKRRSVEQKLTETIGSPAAAVIQAYDSGNRERVTEARNTAVNAAASPLKEEGIRRVLEEIQHLYQDHANRLAAILSEEDVTTKRESVSIERALTTENQSFTRERQTREAELVSRVGSAPASGAIRAFDSGNPETIAEAKKTAVSAAPEGTRESVKVLLNEIEQLYESHATQLVRIQSQEEQVTRRETASVERARAVENQTFIDARTTRQEQLRRTTGSGTAASAIISALETGKTENVEAAKSAAVASAPTGERDQVRTLLDEIIGLYQNHASRLAEIETQEDRIADRRRATAEVSRNAENARFTATVQARQVKLEEIVGKAPAESASAAFRSGNPTEIAEARKTTVAAAPEDRREQVTELLTQIERLYQKHTSRLISIDQEEERAVRREVSAQRQTESILAPQSAPGSSVPGNTGRPAVSQGVSVSLQDNTARTVDNTVQLAEMTLLLRNLLQLMQTRPAASGAPSSSGPQQAEASRILSQVEEIYRLPRFAEGGVTSGPSIAGEAGPELIIPLAKLRKMGLDERNPFAPAKSPASGDRGATPAPPTAHDPGAAVPEIARPLQGRELPENTTAEAAKTQQNQQAAPEKPLETTAAPAGRPGAVVAPPSGVDSHDSARRPLTAGHLVTSILTGIVPPAQHATQRPAEIRALAAPTHSEPQPGKERQEVEKTETRVDTGRPAADAPPLAAAPPISTLPPVVTQEAAPSHAEATAPAALPAPPPHVTEAHGILPAPLAPPTEHPQAIHDVTRERASHVEKHSDHVEKYGSSHSGVTVRSDSKTHVLAESPAPRAALGDLRLTGLPHYDSGGTVESSGLAVIHAGEAVVPQADTLKSSVESLTAAMDSLVATMSGVSPAAPAAPAQTAAPSAAEATAPASIITTITQAAERWREAEEKAFAIEEKRSQEALAKAGAEPANIDALLKAFASGKQPEIAAAKSAAVTAEPDAAKKDSLSRLLDEIERIYRAHAERLAKLSTLSAAPSAAGAAPDAPAPAPARIKQSEYERELGRAKQAQLQGDIEDTAAALAKATGPKGEERSKGVVSAYESGDQAKIESARAAALAEAKDTKEVTRLLNEIEKLELEKVNEAQRTAAAVSEALNKETEDRRKANELMLQGEIQHQQRLLAIKREAIDAQEKLGLISPIEATRRKTAVEQEEFEIQRKAAQEKLAESLGGGKTGKAAAEQYSGVIASGNEKEIKAAGSDVINKAETFGVDPKQAEAAFQELERLYDQHNLAMMKATAQLDEQLHQRFVHMFEPLTQGFEHAIVNITTNAKRPALAFGEMARSVEASWEQALLKMVLDHLKHTKMMQAAEQAFNKILIALHIQKATQEAGIDSAAAAKKTATTVASATTQATAEAGANAIKQASNTAVAWSFVGEAATEAAAAVAWLGPEAAAAAAAATFANLAPYAGIASAEGGWDLPAGGPFPTFLHSREMVLPQEQADTIRSLSGNAQHSQDAQRGGDVHQHYHSYPGESPDSVNRHMNDFSRAYRDGRFRPKVA